MGDWLVCWFNQKRMFTSSGFGPLGLGLNLGVVVHVDFVDPFESQFSSSVCIFYLVVFSTRCKVFCHPNFSTIGQVRFGGFYTMGLVVVFAFL